jgi:nucleotide-binding universal stress UspA family protein
MNMHNQTFLTIVGPDASEQTLGVFLERAAALSAHLDVLVMDVSPEFPITSYGAPPYGPIIIPEQWQEDYSVASARLGDKARDIEQMLERHAVFGGVTTVLLAPNDIAEATGRRAKICDFAYFGNDLHRLPSVYENALQGVLFQSPAAAVLNALPAQTPMDPKRIMIAWNTSLPSARAVRAALPMLRAASSVTIATFDPQMTEYGDGQDPGSDVARWLTHHGSTVTVQQYPSGGKEIGACIQDRAAELGADLVVMGAYGHSRMRQTIFGGTSRLMIQQSDVPVLMAH